MKTKKEYQEALDYIKPRIKEHTTSREDNSDILFAQKTAKDYEAIHDIQELIDNFDPLNEFTTVYGFPIKQVMIWGLMVRETGMSSKELKDRTDLIALGYQQCEKEFWKHVKIVTEPEEKV